MSPKINTKIVLVLAVAIIAVVASAYVFLYSPVGPAEVGTTAPEVASTGVEAASSAADSTAGTFVDEATVTADQVIPDIA